MVAKPWEAAGRQGVWGFIRVLRRDSKQQPGSRSGDQDVDTALSVYPRLCPYWDKKARPGYCQHIQLLLCPVFSSEDTGKEYEQRCPLGLQCPYSHGAKDG